MYDLPNMLLLIFVVAIKFSARLLRHSMSIAYTAKYIIAVLKKKSKKVVKH